MKDLKEIEVFDQMAAGYDDRFTFSLTGKEQRERVRSLLHNRVKPGMKILEINCGTGEDAFFFAGLGCKVTATDGSQEMINICLDKTSNAKSGSEVVFRRLGFDELMTLKGDDPFDLIFSNFSGLNCIGPEELSGLSGVLSTLLAPKGKMILVVFGTRCAWERTYMLLKGRFGKIKRRNRCVPVKFTYLGFDQQVWYYSPVRFSQLFAKHFTKERTWPIGLFLPPTYLDHFFTHKKSLLNLLALQEKWFGNFSFLSDYADHYLTEFRKI